MNDKFALELEQHLKRLGLQGLTGHYPELRCGLFTLEVREEEITIWLGPRQERLARCPLDPARVAQRVFRLKNGLGSHLSCKELLRVLYQAYQRVLVSKGNSGPVPIIEVYSEVARMFKGYTRADFSYDLFRVRGSGQVLLTVATRAFTRRRQDFLWVPDDETGKGTVYSHLKFDKGGVQMTVGTTSQQKQHIHTTQGGGVQMVAETVKQAVEVNARADEAQAQAQVIESAWQTLLSSGIITPEDRALMERRHTDRQLFAIAGDALAKAQQLAEVVAVNIIAPNWVYVVEVGQAPKIVPRVADAPRRKTQTYKTGETSEASKPDAGEADIPTELLRKASEQLGVKWFGRAAALKSKRIVARARELAAAG